MRLLAAALTVLGLLVAAPAATAHDGPLHEHTTADAPMRARPGVAKTTRTNRAARLLADGTPPMLSVVRSVGAYEAMAVDSDGCIYADYGGADDLSRTTLYRSCDEFATPPQAVHTFPWRFDNLTILADGTMFADTRKPSTAQDEIWRSDDRGATWNTACLMNPGSTVCSDWMPRWDFADGSSYVSRLLTDTSIVSDGTYDYLGTYNTSAALFNNENVFYRSADDGRTWQAVYAGSLWRHIHGLVYAPLLGRLIALIGDNSQIDGVWYSDDRAVSWQQLVHVPESVHYDVLVQAALTTDGTLVAGTDIPFGDNAIVRVDPAARTLTRLAEVPYESFCSSSLPGSATLVGSVYEVAGGVKDNDPDLHLYGVAGDQVYSVYSTPIPNRNAWGFLCPVGVLPNGDVPVYRSAYGTVIVHVDGLGGSVTPPDDPPAAPPANPPDDQPPPSASDNLVPDPDFEADPSGSWYHVGDGGTYTWAADQARSPSRSLEITSSSSSLTRWMTRNGRVRMSGGRDVEASAWVRTSGGSARLTIVYYHGAAVLGTASSAATSGDWSQTTVRSRTPASTDSIRIELRYNGPGTAWFDDVEADAR